jgi:glycerol-3-phosphate acyltransferase PlsY
VNNIGVILIWSFLLGSIATSALLCVFRLQDIIRILKRERQP